MAEAIVLREYLETDYPAVTRLWIDVFGALKPEDAPEALARIVARNPGLCLVAEAAGEIAGTVIGTTDGRRGFLYHVAVHAGRRRMGIARRLLAEAERRLWATGIQTIHLRVQADNAGAIAFYRRLGYIVDPPAIIGMRRVSPAE